MGKAKAAGRLRSNANLRPYRGADGKTWTRSFRLTLRKDLAVRWDEFTKMQRDDFVERHMIEDLAKNSVEDSV